MDIAQANDEFGIDGILQICAGTGGLPLITIDNEHARTLVDLLQRRTMAGLAPDFGKRSAPLAADWLVRLGIWDKARAAEEVTAYQQFARRHAVPSR